MYYEVKIKHNEINEDGAIKKVTDNIVIAAVSFTDAEKKAYDYANGFKEVDVTAIKRANYAELHEFDGDSFFVFKLAFLEIDEKTAKEKFTNTYMLIRTDNIDNAKKHLKEIMSDTVSDYTIKSIKETNLIDYVE